MASSGWRTNSPLNKLIFEQYGRFNVFQLVRLLQSKQSAAAKAGAAVQDTVRPPHVQAGLTARLRQLKQEEAGKTSNASSGASTWRIGQRFRFRADLSASFPGREISRLTTIAPLESRRAMRMGKLPEAPEMVEIRTPNFCIASTLGPLPAPFTDWLRLQEKNRDYATRNFLDIFNQRLNVLRFELKAQQTLGLNNLPPEQTLHAHYLASLMGLGQPELAVQVPLARRTWLGLAGLLSNCRRSAFVITHVVSLYVGVPVKLTELLGAWQDIEAEDRIALGRNNHRLGQQSVLGRRTWDQQARIRLDIAPMEYVRFCRFLPPCADSIDIGRPYRYRPLAARQSLTACLLRPVRPASYYSKLLALLRLLIDGQCDCEVRLQVFSDSIPKLALRKNPKALGAGYLGLRLGRTAILGNPLGHPLGDPAEREDAAQEKPPRTAKSVTYLIPAYGHAGRSA